MDIREELKNMLRALHAMSPAYNGIIQMLFLLPQKAAWLINMYPEFMKYENELLELFSLSYDENGFLRAYKSYGNNLGNYLANTFHTLFKMLMEINMRKRLLELAGVSEDEFKGFDPLRAWIEVSLKYLAEVDKGALRLLDMAIIKLSGKGPNGCVELSEKEVAKLININVKDLWALVKKLEKFYLLFRDKYYYSNKIRISNTPLLLDAYQDLRARLREMLG
jgi:hypothetical protein